MRYARLGLIVSAVFAVGVLVSLKSERRPDPPAKAVPEVLHVVASSDWKEIFAAFDRPVVEPEAIGTAAPLEVDFPGRTIWTGVARATFFPETPLPPSRTVNIRVADVAALDGTRLAEPVAWQLTTDGLEIDEWDLPHIAGRFASFELEFNRKVLPWKLAKCVRFEGPTSNVLPLVTGRRVTPMTPLPLGTRWTLVIDESLEAEDGAKLKRAFRHDFTVCRPLTLMRSYGLSSVSSDEEINLHFSNPIQGKKLRSLLSTQPSADFTCSVYGDEALLVGKFAPGTTYWVRIAPGLKDLYGNELGAATGMAQIPAYEPTLSFIDREAFVERHGHRAVRLFSANIPSARLTVERLLMTPWKAPRGEVVSERISETNREPNELFTHGVSLPGPGFYSVEADAVGGSLWSARTYQVTDLALTFKLGRERSLACVTSFNTGAPVSGVELSLHDEEGTDLWEGCTGADGCAKAPGRSDLAKTPKYLIARAADDRAWINLDKSELSVWRLPVGAASPAAAGPLPIYLFTDRPIYRPGETVHVKGLWGADKRSVRIELHDWSSDPVETVSRDVSSTGGFDASFNLSPQAAAGSWSIVVRAGKDFVRKEFEVAWYRTPSFEVKILPGAPHFFPKDRLEATVEARTFFGAPLAGARVRWWTRIGEEGEHSDGEGVLDAKGRLAFGYKLGAGTGPLTIEATVTDASNQSISGEAAVPIHPAAVQVNARCDERLAEVGKPLAFDLQVHRLDGTRADRPLSVRFLRRTWSSVQQLTAGGGWSYVWEHRDELVAAQVVPAGTWKATASAPGRHVLEVRARDDAGREALQTMEIDVAGPGEAGWQRRNDQALDLTTDRELYAVGDTARVLVRGTLPKSRALVTIEREGVGEHRWVDCAGDSLVLDIPIKEAFVPNMHVGVLNIRGRTSKELTKEGEDRGRPALRYGYATISVDTKNRRLPLEVKVAPRFAPGAEVRVDLVTAPCAEITLAVVDQAVLSLLDEPDPDPHAFFWSEHPLQVETSDAHPNLVVAAPMNVRGKKGRPGGGGGGPSWRRYFKGTAFWDPCLRADENGRVSATFRLPDNLTRWRVVAVAATASRWGAGAATFETHKPVMLVSALPRFALLGDSFAARVVVHNRSGAAGRAKVELDGVIREVDIADGKSAPVDFPVAADSIGPRRFAFRAALGSFEDLIEVTVPVKYPGAIETAIVKGRIDGKSDVTLPSMAYVESVWLVLAPNEAALMDAELRRLLEYPHGCVEQTTSKLLPLLGLRQVKIEKADEWIKAGVERLLSMQTREGGFGYWPGDRYPHPSGSVYATHALVLARRANFPVPDAALERALKYVEERLRDPDLVSRPYALYVLSLAGVRRESYLESLAPDPFLTLAAIEMGKVDHARRTLRAPVLVSTGAGDDFHSEVRRDAAWIMACAKLGEDPGMRAGDLLASAQATYERAWALLALGEAARAEPSSRVRVWIDGRAVADQTIDRLVRIDIPFGELRIESEGAVYYAVTVRGCRGEKGPVDRGFWIRRTYTRVGESVPRLDFKAGDLVVVRVSVWSRGGRRYVAIEDPLPAGFEPVDLRFHTERGVAVGGHDFDWIERKDDRVFASERQMDRALYELVYLARATTAGQFAAPAPYVEEMYSPDSRGSGSGATVEVSPR